MKRLYRQTRRYRQTDLGCQTEQRTQTVRATPPSSLRRLWAGSRGVWKERRLGVVCLNVVSRSA